jgi:predicted nucleotidyltransferase
VSALPITIPSELIAEFCKRRRIRRLSLFGSVLTPRFRPESDVDVLVEFEPGAPISYFDLVAMEMELSETLGRKVDLRTPDELSRYFRDEVVAAAMPQYART